MTTTNSSRNIPKVHQPFRLPDPPQREPDEMTRYDHPFKRGSVRYLAIHLGKPGTTPVAANRWIVVRPEFSKARVRRPDLLIAFDVKPAAYTASNGYVVSDQGIMLTGTGPPVRTTAPGK